MDCLPEALRGTPLLPARRDRGAEAAIGERLEAARAIRDAPEGEPAADSARRRTRPELQSRLASDDSAGR